MGESVELGDWEAWPGVRECIQGLGAHDHPAEHPESHRMSRPPRSNLQERHCIERDCSYMERRTISGSPPLRVVPSLSYEAQKRLFDRYHRGKEYVVDAVIHNVKRPSGGN